MFMEGLQRIVFLLIILTGIYITYQLTQLINIFLSGPKTLETDYIHLVDHYQVTKMQRLLLEEQYSLAKSKNKILELAKQLQQKGEAGLLQERTAQTFANLPTRSSFKNKVEAEHLSLSVEEAKTFEQLEEYMVTNRPTQIKPYTTNEKQLLTVAPDYYTLQLMGVRDTHELAKFIKDNHLDNQAMIFHTFYLNKDWYVAVYGSYKNHTEALKAIETLPENIKHLKPWIRQLASVHKAIQLYR